MKTEQIKNQFEYLPVSVKISLVEDLWDSIAEDNGNVPMPEWQKQELDKRYKKYQTGQLELHDWQAVHHDIRKHDK